MKIIHLTIVFCAIFQSTLACSTSTFRLQRGKYQGMMCSSIVEDMYLKFMKVLKPEFIFQMQTFKMCFDKHRLSSKALSVTCGDEFWHTLVECSWYLPMKWGNSVRQNPTEDQTRFCQMDPSHRMCLQMCNILMTRIKGDYREFVPNWDDATPEAICYKIKEIHPNEVLYGKEEGSGEGSGDDSGEGSDMSSEETTSEEGSDSKDGSDSDESPDGSKSCEVDTDCEALGLKCNEGMCNNADLEGYSEDSCEEDSDCIDTGHCHEGMCLMYED